MNPQALQVHRTAGAELYIAAGFDDLADERTHEHFATLCLCRHACRHDHVAAIDVSVVAEDHLAGVDAGSYPNRFERLCCPVRVQRALHVHHAGDRAAGTSEGEHEAVALRLHLGSTMASDHSPHDGVVRVEHPHPRRISEFHRAHRGPLDVREHDSHRPDIGLVGGRNGSFITASATMSIDVARKLWIAESAPDVAHVSVSAASSRPNPPPPG